MSKSEVIKQLRDNAEYLVQNYKHLDLIPVVEMARTMRYAAMALERKPK